MYKVSRLRIRIVSQRRDTLYISMLMKYHTDVIASRLCDSIMQTWFRPNCNFHGLIYFAQVFSLKIILTFRISIQLISYSIW